MISCGLCCSLTLHVIENVKTAPGNALEEPKTVFKNQKSQTRSSSLKHNMFFGSLNDTTQSFG